MDIPTYKSLCKPMTWCGIPRNIMLIIVFLGLLSIVLFQSIRGIIPIIVLYLILLALMRVDYKILSILQENMKLKDVYYPD